MINHQITFYLKDAKKVFSIKFVSVLIISIPSAIIFDYFNIPLAWFLGPMIITSIAALSGLKIIMPKIVLSFILIILGLHIGNYIDQNLFNQMLDWIWTSLIMLIYIIILRPDKAAIDVTIIGPKNQAKGMLKYSEKIAVGTEIKITIINFFEKTCFKSSK